MRTPPPGISGIATNGRAAARAPAGAERFEALWAAPRDATGRTDPLPDPAELAAMLAAADHGDHGGHGGHGEAPEPP
ncbi:MAG TPA: hypothetical protein VGP05_03195 [Pseudonocardia sp.]|nr:hypothetical protein [Pseudonocardia sp.]